MSRSKAIEDQADLIGATRYVVLRSVGVNDLESVRFVVIELERTITRLRKEVSRCWRSRKSLHKPHRGILADRAGWLPAVD